MNRVSFFVLLVLVFGIGFRGDLRSASAVPSAESGSAATMAAFEEWIVKSGVEPGHRGPEDDPAGDNIPNLIKFIFGLDPLTPSQDLLPRPTTIIHEGREYLYFEAETFPEAGDFERVVEVSTDLVEWDSGPGHTVVLRDFPEVIMVRDAVATDDAGARFMRFRVFYPVIETIVFTNPLLNETVRRLLAEEDPDFRDDPDKPITRAHVDGITELYLNGGPDADLKEIEYLRNLEVLHVAHLSNLSDISPLAALSGLKELHISGAAISDLSPLAGLSDLTDLDLSGNAPLTNITALAGLPLVHLDLSGTGVTDLSQLGSLPSLESLRVNNTPLTSFAGVESFPGLKELLARDASISDVSALDGHPSLSLLHLHNNPLSDIAAFGHLPELRTLVLRGTQVSLVHPLRDIHMPKLWSLDLRDTQVEFFYHLENSAAERFWLSGTPANWCEYDAWYVVDQLLESGAIVETGTCDGPYFLHGTITVKDGSEAPSEWSLIDVAFESSEGSWEVTTILDELWDQQVEGEVTVTPILGVGWAFEPESITMTRPGPVNFEVYRIHEVQGTLVDDEGNPLQGQVYLANYYNPNQNFPVETDANGFFRHVFPDQAFLHALPVVPGWEFDMRTVATPHDFGEWAGVPEPQVEGRIAFVHENTIYTIDADGGTPQAVTSVHFSNQSWISGQARPSWSPDGTRILYMDGEFQEKEIWRVDVSGANKTRVVGASHFSGSNQVNFYAGSWAANGSIAYAARRKDGANPAIAPMLVYRTTVGGGQGSTITDGGFMLDPAWSPDGTRLAVSGDPSWEQFSDGVNFGIYTMNATGGNPSSRLGSGRRPAWSPDGNYLAFDHNGQIRVRDLASGDTYTLTAGTHATWSPDGQWIAFENDGNIYRIESAEGSSSPVLITAGREPSWAP